MPSKHRPNALFSVFLLASCAGASTTKPASTLLADEDPAVVIESKTGDFHVDTATGLAWSTRVSVPLQLAETSSYCESLGKGWRVPTIGELQTTMEGESEAMKMKPVWRAGLPSNGLLFSSEEIPRIDDHKQPFVMRIESGKSFADHGLEGYVRCVHGDLSREQGPMPMPPDALLGERWWEQTDACPPGAVARGTVGRQVACTSADGQTDGRLSAWTPTQRSDASYRNATLHGVATKWRADGLKISQETYVDGQLAGRSAYWHENGEKARETDYAGGKLDGKDVTWRPDGLKESELSYRNGELHGRSTVWHPSGEKYTEASYADGKLQGRAQKWRADGLEESDLSYRNGELHGRSTVWYASGEKFTEATYASGKLHGKALKWRADGLKESEMNYRNGDLYGTVTTWFPNGETATQASYANGKLNGKSLTWRADGLKESERNYRNDELHGTSTAYFPNGETSSESNYASGLMSGVYQGWNEQGLLLERTVYAEARVIERIHYDQGEPRNGAIETKYPNGVASYIGVFKDGHAQGKHYGFYPDGKPKFERNYNAKGIPSGRSVDWYPSGQARETSRFVRGALHGERTLFSEEGERQASFQFNQGILVVK